MSDKITETWTIRELTENEYPGTQLRYAVYNEQFETVSVHHWEEDALQMAAVPKMQLALYDALTFIEEVARDCGLVPEKDVLVRLCVLTSINAALKAVEGKK